MPAYLRANSITNPSTRRIIQQAVLDAVDDLPGDWFVVIREAADSPAWAIEIIGPNNFFWRRNFFGPAEQDEQGDFVRTTVRSAVS
jgi:hypothetical protein